MIAVQEPVASSVEDAARAGESPPVRQRREWMPKPRDQALYLAVRAAGRTQASVAEDFQVSQSRVSRTVQRMDRWRSLVAEPGASPPDVEECLAHQAFERQLCRQRLEEVHTLSMRLAERLMEGPAVTKRQGERNGKEWSETTERDQSVTASQCLKTALRASEALLKLDDGVDYETPRKEAQARVRAAAQAAAEAETKQGPQRLTEQELCDELQRLREEAEAAGRVRCNRSSTPWFTVAAWLEALVGKRTCRVSPGAVGPSSVFAELATSVLSLAEPHFPATEALRRLADTRAREAAAETQGDADAAGPTDPTCIKMHNAEAPAGQAADQTEAAPQAATNGQQLDYDPFNPLYLDLGGDEEERRKRPRLHKWDCADDELGRLHERIRKRLGLPRERDLE